MRGGSTRASDAIETSSIVTFNPRPECTEYERGLLKIEPHTAERQLREVYALEHGPAQVGVAQTDTTQVGATEVSITQVGSFEVGGEEVGIDQPYLAQAQAAQVAVAQADQRPVAF